MRKFVVQVVPKSGSKAKPLYLSGFHAVGSHCQPILTGKGCALMLKLSTANYFVRKLADLGYSASVEVFGNA